MNTATSSPLDGHYFGIRPPDGIPGAAWGARAIYRLKRERVYRNGRPAKNGAQRTVAEIDLVWDRQSWQGGSNRERDALKGWINRRGLVALRRACAKAYLAGNSDELVTVERDGYVITASPKRSHGYLYIGAWKVSG
jgi:hypothetical protein